MPELFIWFYVLTAPMLILHYILIRIAKSWNSYDLRVQKYTMVALALMWFVPVGNILLIPVMLIDYIYNMIRHMKISGKKSWLLEDIGE